MDDEVHVIKQFNNRKLYSMNLSCYVTLTEILDMVINKEHIKVYHHKTKQDITGKILLKVIMINEEKNAESFADTYRYIIQDFYNLNDLTCKLIRRKQRG